MDISVIVPIYGVEKYIEKSLRSLFSQTKTDGVEFILVNDCTKDRSMDIARDVAAAYPTLNIVLIDHQQNGGVAMARQTGLDTATGDYTIHFDPDDWCEPEMLEELYHCAIERDADIVACDFYVNYPNKQLYKRQPIIEGNALECVKLILEDKIHGALWNKLIRRSLFITQNICFTPNVNLWEDKLITSKLFYNTNNIAYLPKAYLHYLQRENSIVHSETISSALNKKEALEDISSYLKSKGAYEKFNESLIASKINTKLGLMRLQCNKERKQSALLYPEVNEHIMNTPGIRIYWRVGLYCASKRHIWVFNIIKTIISPLKRLRDRK